MIDQKRLEEIGARAEKAASGPWQSFYEDDGGYDAMSSAYTICAPDDEHICLLDTGIAPWHADKSDEIPIAANADFIAQARQDIPNLLAEIERLQTAVSDLEEGTEWPGQCEVCGHGVLWGSRHSNCGELVLRAENSRKQALKDAAAAARSLIHRNMGGKPMGSGTNRAFEDAAAAIEALI